MTSETETQEPGEALAGDATDFRKVVDVRADGNLYLLTEWIRGTAGDDGPEFSCATAIGGPLLVFEFRGNRYSVNVRPLLETIVERHSDPAVESTLPEMKTLEATNDDGEIARQRLDYLERQISAVDGMRNELAAVKEIRSFVAAARIAISANGGE